MKISEFYPALTEATEKLGIEWTETNAGELRGYGAYGVRYCPITAVCASETNVYVDDDEYPHAARLIGIRRQDGKLVATAADSEVPSVADGCADDKIRDELKRAIGFLP